MRLLGWLKLQIIRVRWRWLRTVSAGEYVNAAARYYMRERDDKR